MPRPVSTLLLLLSLVLFLTSCAVDAGHAHHYRHHQGHPIQHRHRSKVSSQAGRAALAADAVGSNCNPMLARRQDVTVTLTTTTVLTIQVTSTVASAGYRATHALSSTPVAQAFDPAASTNIAVYYGQDPEASVHGLGALCFHPRISIINIAFVTNFFSGGGFPATAFGPACNLPQNHFMRQRALDLQNCSTLGRQISTCQQQYGKKIFVSLGGYTGTSAFTSTAQAQQFATTMWNLFGGGTATPNLRPFGRDVVVDGFDIDNEDHSTACYYDFAAALRARFKQDLSRKYYLSAAPQCPRPDASIPLAVLRMCDFVHVQFYNNPACNLDSTGFASSLAGWSSGLKIAGKPGPRLLVGIPAWTGAGSGYVAGPELSRLIPSASTMRARYPNFGGIMMWAGAEAVSNVDSQGLTFLQHVAAILRRQ